MLLNIKNIAILKFKDKKFCACQAHTKTSKDVHSKINVKIY